MRTVKAVTLISVVTAAVALGGCMGGGTLGSGLPGGEGFGSGQTRLSTTRYVVTQGSVVAENGRPLPNAVVKATTSKGSEVIRTDAQGRFELNLPLGSAEGITFHITSGTRSGEYVSKGIGIGVDVVLFNFRFVKGNRLIVVE